MKMQIFKYLFLALVLCGTASQAEAQKKKKSMKKTTKTKSKAKIQSTAPSEDTVVAAVAPPPPAAPEPSSDTLPMKVVKKSLRPDEAVESSVLRERTPLAYEHLRADDAVYRHRIWRELDTREKFNHTFNYAADADNGNQRFISILLNALQDSTKEITAFASIDDRFTTPMTKAEIAKAVVGEEIDVPDYDSLGNMIGTKKKRNEVNLDSFYKYHIKEEVIFDKESSRLFWRILGIAPVKNIITSQGVDLGPSELFWIYYPDIRPILATYEVFNGKNFGGRMSWEELFESRMFSARIIKSSYDNARDLKIVDFPGMKENGILQLFEGENVKERIFSYEQDLWSY
jgi:gliding motility associated protien GldN